jgi:hypothetical protein
MSEFSGIAKNGRRGYTADAAAKVFLASSHE